MAGCNGTANFNASPKFGGQSLTKLLSGTVSTTHGELWYLLAPPVGLGTFNGTFSANVTPKSAVGIAYKGVNQTTPIIGSTSVLGTNVANGSITNTALGAGNWFAGGFYDRVAPGTTATGVERGTAFGNAEVTSGMDSTGGTLRLTTATGTFIGIGVELAAITGISNLIQSAGTSDVASTATSASWLSNTTNGNLIVAGMSIVNALSLGTVSSVTDTQGNTYVRALRGTISEATSVIDAELWYAKNIVGGAGSVTANHLAGNTALYVREYSGFNTLDITNSATGSSAAPNSGTSAATTVASELLIVATGDDKGPTQTYAAAGNYVDMAGTTATLSGISMEDGTVGATGAQTGTVTLGASANWVSLFASFYSVPTQLAVFKNMIGVGI